MCNKIETCNHEGNSMYRYEQWITVLILCVSCILKIVSLFTLYTVYAHATIHRDQEEQDVIITQKI